MLSSISFSVRYRAAGLLWCVAGLATAGMAQMTQAPSAGQDTDSANTSQTLAPSLAAVPATSAATAPISSSSVPAPALSPETADPAPIGSQVRIVRLSQVRGAAQLNRNTGRGFEPAFANIPVIAGAELRTGQGIAEVEFEDNSSLRLAPESEVRFTTLSRMPTGSTVTEVAVVKGLVFADVEKTKGNLFELANGAAKLTLLPGTHLRLEATSGKAELAVFDGQTQIALNGTTTVLNKHQSVDLDPTVATVSAARHEVQETAYDGWDKQEADYHKQKAGLASSGGFGLYGANDLNYYGSFTNMPGCGSLWRPYFASAGWDPFANGVWAWYPTAGYSWVSPYPWGWLPFHSGSWISCGGAGWGWQPTGQWYGLSNSVAMRIARHPVHPMPVAPAPHTATTLVPVNMQHITVSGTGRTAEAFTFRRDSAGLGVPRSTFGSLRGISNNAERHGLVTSPVTASALPAERLGSPGHGIVGAPTSPSAGLHSAYAPHASNSNVGSHSSGSGSAGSFSGGHSGGGGGSLSAPSGGATSSGGAHK